MAQAADDPDGQARVAAFLQGLRELGWFEGRNVQLDYRRDGGDVGRIRRDVVELVALTPADKPQCRLAGTVAAGGNDDVSHL